MPHRLLENSRLLESVVLVSSSAFAGIATHVSVAEQPSRRVISDVGSLLAQWRMSYSRVAPIQATLALLSGSTALYLGYQAPNSSVVAKLWLLGGGLMLAELPFTMAAIMPVNKRLNSTQAEYAPEAEVRTDVEDWGKLHTARTILSAVAVGLFVAAVVRA